MAPVGEVALSYVAITWLSPPAALVGTTTLIWYRPGLMRPANDTVAVTPPMLTCGKVGSSPVRL